MGRKAARRQEALLAIDQVVETAAPRTGSIFVAVRLLHPWWAGDEVDTASAPARGLTAGGSPHGGAWGGHRHGRVAGNWARDRPRARRRRLLRRHRLPRPRARGP